MKDYIVRASAANAQIRAFAAVTTELTEEARKRHETSPVATAALGRLLTGGAMMGSMMKNDTDMLTIQIKCSGPIGGLTVTADSKGNVKGYVHEPNVILPPKNGKLDVGGALGQGVMTVIKDMGLKEPYSGQTILQTGEIAEDLTYYFATSEQVPSSVGLGVLMEKDNTVRCAGGFIVQVMPFIEEYWTLDVILKIKGEKRPLTAKFYGTDQKKMTIRSEQELNEIVKKIENAEFKVSDIKTSERFRKAPLPFTTSTLQQEAAKALNFGTQKTMRIAQQLYEGVDIKGGGTVGVITYLRTDSTRIADEADASAREYIASVYGEKYIAAGQTKQAEGKKIQDAHEAIRPTDISRTPASIKESLTRDQFRLYQLIWKRFAASRMMPAQYESTSVKIAAGQYRFSVSTSRCVFDGFRSVYTEADEEKEESNVLVGHLSMDSVFTREDFDTKQHFTQPPAHYTEASLVKALEELGIGRPSTYAPTISIILGRRYVTKEAKNLYLTEIGEVVNNIMKQSFPSIVDANFTANMEGLLDMVEEGKVAWKDVIRNFYPDLDEAVKRAEIELESVKIEDEVTDVICEECGRNMVIKYGPHGKFLACPGFPECRNTKPYLEKIGVPCPVCGKDVVIRKTKKGRKYYGCENNPECDFMSWQKPSKEKCPDCGGYMLEKGNKLVCADEKCGYVKTIGK